MSVQTNRYVAPTLRGILVRDEEDKVIVQATPQDIRAFGQQAGTEVRMQPEAPDVRMRVGRAREASPFTYLYGSQVAGWPVGCYTTAPILPDPGPGRLVYGDYLYDRQGRPVAVMTTLRVNVQNHDITTFGGTRQVLAGMAEVEIEAVAVR